MQQTNGRGSGAAAKIGVHDAASRIASGDGSAQQQGGAVLVDVRGYDEFAAGHAAGAICIPLPELEQRAASIAPGCEVLVMCQSGGRSAMAAERLRALGFPAVCDVQGGFSAWKAAGLPAALQRGAVPLERQVRGVAGALVFGFTLAGAFTSRWLLVGSGFVGFMLFLSSVTGFCPMLSLLARMPWNRVARSSRLESSASV